MANAPDDTEPLNKTTLMMPLPKPAGFVSMQIDFDAQTHVGSVRSNNEDQYLVVRVGKSLEVLATSLPDKQNVEIVQREGYVLLVADGMGGHSGGELASAFVVRDALRYLMETAKWFFRYEDPDADVRLRLLRETLEHADQTLRQEAAADPELKGMGTTLTAVSIIGNDAFLVHVGDSRVYLFRDGVLEQLTTDHTLVQKMIEQGTLTPERARKHYLRHVITNVIGGPPGVKAEMSEFRLAVGDRLLLCTDGLTEPVPNETIAEILQRDSKPQEASCALIEMALRNGGPDNVTVIVANCVNEDQNASGIP
jgi:protein phosphatase